MQFVCFNLEMWSEPLFAKVCPGKNRYVGYHRWIEALETAVRYWGRGNVYSAMVAGIELEPEHGLEWEEAAKHRARRRRGPLPSRHHSHLLARLAGRAAATGPDYHERIRSYFETLSAGYQEIRRRHGLDSLRRLHVPSLRLHAAGMRLDRATMQEAA